MGSAALRFRDVRPSVRAAPGNTTRLDDFWRYIHLYVCMYVPGMYSALLWSVDNIVKVSHSDVTKYALSAGYYPAKARDYGITGVGLSVRLSVCYHDN